MAKTGQTPCISLLSCGWVTAHCQTPAGLCLGSPRPLHKSGWGSASSGLSRQKGSCSQQPGPGLKGMCLDAGEWAFQARLLSSLTPCSFLAGSCSILEHSPLMFSPIPPSQTYDQGSSLGPLHWEHRVQAPTPSGKSQGLHFLSKTFPRRQPSPLHLGVSFCPCRV